MNSCCIYRKVLSNHQFEHDCFALELPMNLAQDKVIKQQQRPSMSSHVTHDIMKHLEMVKKLNMGAGQGERKYTRASHKYLECTSENFFWVQKAKERENFEARAMKGEEHTMIQELKWYQQKQESSQ